MNFKRAIVLDWQTDLKPFLEEKKFFDDHGLSADGFNRILTALDLVGGNDQYLKGPELNLQVWMDMKKEDDEYLKEIGEDRDSFEAQVMVDMISLVYDEFGISKDDPDFYFLIYYWW